MIGAGVLGLEGREVFLREIVLLVEDAQDMRMLFVDSRRRDIDVLVGVASHRS